MNIEYDPNIFYISWRSLPHYTKLALRLSKHRKYQREYHGLHRGELTIENNQ
jgi:hypothetical protein